MAENHQRLILIVAGGTGGHVMPALAVAEYLIEQGIAVHWLGTAHGIESKIVPAKQIPLHTISITGLRGKGFKAKLLAPFKALRATFQSIRLILKLKPQVLLTMGGYVSGPAGLAAWLLRRPMLIHEQNAIGGFTNRILAKIASRILLAYPNAIQAKKQTVEVTGNPLRKEFIQAHVKASEIYGKSRIHILVLGGSQGALSLNQMVPKAMQQINRHQDYAIVHQTGEKHIHNTASDYAALQVKADIKPFIEDMVAAYRWADIIICRAGALTVAETLQCGKACIFIPFPYAVDNHQFYNAKFVHDEGGAILLPESELTPKSLAQAILSLSDTQTRRQMEKIVKQLANPTATANVAKACLNFMTQYSQ